MARTRPFGVWIFFALGMSQHVMISWVNYLTLASLMSINQAILLYQQLQGLCAYYLSQQAAAAVGSWKLSTLKGSISLGWPGCQSYVDQHNSISARISGNVAIMPTSDIMCRLAQRIASVCGRYHQRHMIIIWCQTLVIPVLLSKDDLLEVQSGIHMPTLLSKVY